MRQEIRNELTLRQYPPHHAASLFPMMDKKTLAGLAEDIKQNGLRDPIVLHNDQVLDGRNRLIACGMVGVEPRFIDAELNGRSPTLFVVSRNLHRRHLKRGQMIAVGVDMLPRLRAEAKERQRKGKSADGTAGGRGHKRVNLPADSPGGLAPPEPDDLHGESRDIAARAVGESAKAIQCAAAIKERDPELYEKVKRDEVPIYKAFDIVKGKAKLGARELSPREQSRRGATAKRRMVEGLSHIRGLCRGLIEIDTAILRAALTEDERRTWAAICHENARRLREFGNQIKDETHDGNNDTHQGNQRGRSDALHTPASATNNTTRESQTTN